MKILITGGYGQLGRILKSVLEPKHEVYAWDIEDLDITKPLDTLLKVTNLHPELIIHCGAYTDVRGCECDPERAYSVNWLGTRNLALAAGECSAKFVYISTDYVFDGEKDTPYVEFDTPNPLSVYGKSKMAGEQVVQSLLHKYYIVRTAWLYSEWGNNFMKSMLKLAEEKRQISVVFDQRGTPTYAYDLALAIEHLITEPLYGIYHLTNSGACSWFEFANKIFELRDIDVHLNPITSAEYGDIVKRPANSILHNFNFEFTYGFVLRDWEEALEHCMTRLIDVKRG